MKKIGDIFRERRLSKKLLADDVERETKIKKEFVLAIEKHQWDSLPEFAVVTGFVKNLASFLGVDTFQAVALLKRDYPPKKLMINPKPDIEKRAFFWTPRISFLIGSGLFALVIFLYLIFQYRNFVRPPYLVVDSPTEGETLDVGLLTVYGKTDAEASVLVNDQPTLVSEDGVFSAEIAVISETKQIVVKAVSRSGRESSVTRNVIVKKE